MWCQLMLPESVLLRLLHLPLVSSEPRPVGSCAESLCQQTKSSETKAAEFLKKLLSAAAKCSFYTGGGIKAMEMQ